MTKRTRAANAAALPADSHPDGSSARRSTASIGAPALPVDVTRPDRRTLLASAGAAAALIASTAPAALAMPAAQPVDPDAALMALRHNYDRTRAAWALSWPAHTQAEDRYFDLRESHPDWTESALQQRSGLAAVTPIYERLENENHDVVQAMVDEPARTLRGAIAKAEVSRDEDNMNPDLIASLVADLVAMKAETA